MLGADAMPLLVISAVAASVTAVYGSAAMAKNLDVTSSDLTVTDMPRRMRL